MVYLHMKAMDFGIEAESVRAAYSTVEEAQAQANHNIETGKQVPLRIVDGQDKVLINYEK